MKKPRKSPKIVLDLSLYRLGKTEITDYRDNDVSVLNWIEIGDISSKDILEDVMVDRSLPYGIYCTDNGDESQYFEYFDMDKVPDAMSSIYNYNREPKLAAFRIHFAEVENVRHWGGWRYTGRVYSANWIFQHLLVAPDECNYIGDMHPDEFMEEIYEQFKKEKKGKNKRRSAS